MASSMRVWRRWGQEALTEYRGKWYPKPGDCYSPGYLSRSGVNSVGLEEHWGSRWLGLVSLGSTLGYSVAKQGREQPV